MAAVMDIIENLLHGVQVLPDMVESLRKLTRRFQQEIHTVNLPAWSAETMSAVLTALALHRRRILPRRHLPGLVSILSA
jgi:hypothetical protein